MKGSVASDASASGPFGRARRAARGQRRDQRIADATSRTRAPAIVDRRQHQRDVEFALPQRGEQHVARRLAAARAARPDASAELGRAAGQHVVRRHADEPEREGADLARREPRAPALSAVGLAQQAARLREERRARGRELHRALGAREERACRAPPPARGSGATAAAGRCCSARAARAKLRCFGDGDEVAYMAQLH